MIRHLFDKIVLYLKAREGYDVSTDDIETNVNSVSIIVQDVLGYRYEVRVKSLGRIYGAGLGDVKMKDGSFMQGGFDV